MPRRKLNAARKARRDAQRALGPQGHVPAPPASSTTAPSAPAENSAEMANLTTAATASSAPTDWRKKYDEEVDKNALAYEETMRDKQRLDDLQAELDQVKKDLSSSERYRKQLEKSEKQLREGSEYHDLEIEALTKDRDEERTARRKLHNDLQKAQQSLADAQAFADTMQAQAMEKEWHLTNLESDIDEKNAQLAGADEKHTELENHLKAAQEEAADNLQAAKLMEAINETLEVEFARLGQELTPDKLQSYFNGLVAKAEMKRNISEASIDSGFAQFASQPLPKGRRGTGPRNISLHDELDQLDESNFEQDEKSPAVEYVNKETMTMTTTEKSQEPQKPSTTTATTQTAETEPVITQPVITQPTILHHHTVHTVHDHKTSKQNIPFLLKFLMGLMFLIWASLSIAAYRERRMWLDANTVTYSTIQYYQQPNVFQALFCSQHPLALGMYGMYG